MGRYNHGYYGTCSECGVDFSTSWEYDEHPCMQAVMKLSKEELEKRLIAKGKMKPRKVQ